MTTTNTETNTNRSQTLIGRWEGIMLNKWNEPAGSERHPKIRLRAFLCSLALGRDFGEDVEAYYEREGLTGFVAWARARTGR